MCVVLVFPLVSSVLWVSYVSLVGLAAVEPAFVDVCVGGVCESVALGRVGCTCSVCGRLAVWLSFVALAC